VSGFSRHSVVSLLPTGMAQVSRLSPKVGGHLAPCCIHGVNRLISRRGSACHDYSTIKIVLVLLLPPPGGITICRVCWCVCVCVCVCVR